MIMMMQHACTQNISKKPQYVLCYTPANHHPNHPNYQLQLNQRTSTQSPNCHRRRRHVNSTMSNQRSQVGAALRPGRNWLRWTIVDRLGAGAFGEVYRIRDNNGQHYALKTESTRAQNNVLMMDVTVLQEAGRQNFNHFCQCIDAGRYRDDFFYLVMTLVGRSLHDLRKARPTEHFTMGTAIGAAIQTLEAIEELHSIGYLHRDIKPGNYSIGLQRGELRRIYILDFGMCRRYIRRDGTLRRPRAAAGFRGTPRYAALRCHQNMEYCRADDIESWIYMCVELTTAAIPWRRVTNMHELGDWKGRLRTDGRAMDLLFKGCPPEFRQIMGHVITLGYYDRPAYNRYYTLLRRAMTTMNANEFPYDWEQQQQTRPR